MCRTAPTTLPARVDNGFATAEMFAAFRVSTDLYPASEATTLVINQISRKVAYKAEAREAALLAFGSAAVLIDAGYDGPIDAATLATTDAVTSWALDGIAWPDAVAVFTARLLAKVARRRRWQAERLEAAEAAMDLDDADTDTVSMDDVFVN
jgi:hypothetical protein